MIILLNYKVDEIIKNEINEEDDIKTKIKKIHDYTKYLETSPKNTIGKEYHKDFKRLLYNI